MKTNYDKCYLPVSKNENASMHVVPFEIKSSNCRKVIESS